MIFKLFRTFGTVKTVYTKILKPIYEELRKDAYASENTEPIKRKKRTNVINQKPKRRNSRKANP